jgi:predicted transcriptional regulator of viral defense system
MDKVKRNWNRLYEIAATQDGHISRSQAATVGYSRQLLAKRLANNRLERVSRGIHRIVHYPYGDHEKLTVLWLWSE